MKRFGFVALAVLGFMVAIGLADAPAGSDSKPDVKDVDAQHVIQVMDAADAKAYADYLRVVQKNHQAAFTKLNARKGELTRLGKLDDAVLIRDFIDYITKQDQDNAAIASGTKLFMPLNAVVGTWGEHSGSGPFYQILANGRFVYDNNEPGTWQLTSDALILTWNTKSGQHNVGRVDTYDRIDGKALIGTSSAIGHQVQIDRVEH